MKPFHHKVFVRVNPADQTHLNFYTGKVEDFGCHVENLKCGDYVTFNRNDAQWVKDTLYVVDCCDIVYTE